MANVKWIKICTDIFDDEKILLIESMPEADSIIVIWFKLLCLAGKQNNKGVFMLNDKIAYTDEMLSSIFRRSLNTIRLALKTFEMYGMIEIVDNVITIPNWDKHQSLDALEKKKEYDRQYQAKKRRQQKLMIEEKNRTTSNDKNTTVVALEEEIEKEEDKDKDKDKENIIKDIFDCWNNQKIIIHRELTSDIKKEIKKSLTKYDPEELKTFICRYGEMFNSNYSYCKYKWSLKIFLTRKEGVSEFTDEGSKWNNYLSWKDNSNNNQSTYNNNQQPKSSKYGDGSEYADLE